MSSQGVKPVPEEIRRALSLLHEPGAVYEIRALGGRLKRALSGYFDDHEKATRAAIECVTRGAEGVYVTLNPVNPALKARANNRLVEPQKGGSTADKEITARRWLFIDVDPARPSGISSTAREHQDALDKAHRIAPWLTRCGWPAPVFADSGNGAHLLYRVELAGDDGGLVKRVLASLDAVFSDCRTKVDTGNHNPARLVKLYGTVARKGDNTTDRPHRLARLLEVPDELEHVPRRRLEEITAFAESIAENPGLAADHANNGGGDFDVRAWLAGNGIELMREDGYGGGVRLTLRQCPFGAHTREGKAAVFVSADRRLGFKCFSDDHAGYGWRELRAKYEPKRASGLSAGSSGAPASIPTDGTGKKNRSEPIASLISLATVQPEPVTWLWHHRIPAGKLSLLVGDPGLGKSLVACAIAAHVSAGREFPDSAACPRGDTIIMSAEDGVADTVVPRLLASGADCSRVHQLKIQIGADERLFSLETDLGLLRERLKVLPDARLVIIDPLTAYLGDTEPHKDARVRAILAPLAAMAAESRIAILGVMHLNKAATLNAVYRVTGSIAFVAQARAVWAIAADPADANRRLMLKLKANLCPPNVSGLAFRTQENSEGQVTLVWETEPVTLDIHQLLDGARNQHRARGPKADKREQAERVIRDALADGEAHLSQPIIEAASKAGISHRTLLDTARALGVVKRKDGFQGAWTWQLTELPGQNSVSLGNNQENSASLPKSFSEKGCIKDADSASLGKKPKTQSFVGPEQDAHENGVEL